MASSVAQALERQLAQIPGVAQMTSTSYLGTTAVTIQFDLNRMTDGAANDVQAAINAAGGQLPKNLPSPPTYRKVNPADSPILLLSATSDTLPLTEVSDAVDAGLAQQISQISGVAQVTIGGQQKPAIRIQIDPGKLVAKGLSLEDVRSQIVITTVDSPKGNIDGATRAYTIYANDQLTASKDWNDVIVAYRNGGPLRIRDIGRAVTGPEDAKQAAWANGKRGVFLVVYKQPGANVIDTVDKIKATLPRLVAAIPPALKIDIISDRTQTIRAAVEDVQFTLLLTIALVVMVIFIFLRSFWATVIPTVTVPLALLGACALMWVFGYTLDNLSLMALTIAVGFVFDAMLRGYERGLDLALRWRLTTLAIFFATLGLSVYLFVIIPKGFFPQQDVGLITATSEANQDISFADMKRHQEELGKIVMADPDVATIAMNIGGSGRAGNNGNMFITLKPRNERTATAQQIISRLRPKLDKVEGARLFMQAAQDVRLGGRPTRTQFEFTLQDANLAELNEWAPKILGKMQTLPELRDVATDQQTQGTTLALKINRETAGRYGIQPQLIDDTLYDAFGQRQVTQYFTQLNSYHVILEILPELQGNLDTLNKIYIKSPTTGDQVPLSTFASWTSVPVRSLSISHQGQFPAITISFNLAQGVALGQATNAVQKAMVELGAPTTLNSSFQGTAQAFQQSLGTVPLLILAALVVVYLILGILYESYIHPITILSTLPSAGIGALAILMAFGFDFSLIALIGIILLIGIVKKNGIMMVDFAISAERDEHLSPEAAIRKAALLRFRPIMMTTMAALLGGVPLMLGAGTGAEIRQPLGYAMVGGLLVSQALTLYTTPVIYIYLDRLSNYLTALGRSEDADHERPASERASIKQAAE